MQTILQVEFSPSLALIREGILTSIGYEVISVIGSVNSRNLGLVKQLSVIIIGHGSPWDEREQLIKYFGEALPGVPIVALLRMRDANFSKAAFSIRADNPQNWVRVINRFTSAHLPRHIQVSESACR
jgi:hypothetical protein